MRENVDDRGKRFPVPVEGPQLFEHELGIGKIRYRLGGKEVAQEQDVVERDGHATARQGMPHVHRVAEENESRREIRAGREEGVGHASQPAPVERGCERWLHARREGRQDLCAQMCFHAAVGVACAGQVRGHVDERARLVRADLVQEDGRVLAEDDVPVRGSREVGVDELETVEFGGGGRFVRVVGLAELGGVAVGDDGLWGKVEVWGALSRGGDAEDVGGIRRGYEGGNGGLHEQDVAFEEGGFAETADEAAVVKGAAFGADGAGFAIPQAWLLGLRDAVFGVGNMYTFAIVYHLVTLHHASVNAVEALPESELFEGLDAAWL